MQKAIKIFFILFFIFFGQIFGGEIKEPYKNMSISLLGGGSFPLIGGGAYGGGVRFEWAFLPALSGLVHADYREIYYGGFSESSQFRTMSGGLGARFYFSQLFFRQNLMSGFYIESLLGTGLAFEQPGLLRGVIQSRNQGLTIAWFNSIGYNHAFDFGLVLGGGIGFSSRSFFEPIKQKGLIVHPNPELLLQVGYSF
ncbi:MAG: hypothetical protein H6731_06805 [Myxococcales bacterium]|nr:MAG: hypothetical protein H6731_06805 [Myxococcales bacterium]